jgi:hypothetical protein
MVLLSKNSHTAGNEQRKRHTINHLQVQLVGSLTSIRFEKKRKVTSHSEVKVIFLPEHIAA